VERGSWNSWNYFTFLIFHINYQGNIIYNKMMIDAEAEIDSPVKGSAASNDVSDISLTDDVTTTEVQNDAATINATKAHDEHDEHGEESVADKAINMALAMAKATGDAVGKAAEVATDAISKLHENEKTSSSESTTTDSEQINSSQPSTEKESIWSKVRRMSKPNNDVSAEVTSEITEEQPSLWSKVRRLSAKPNVLNSATSGVGGEHVQQGEVNGVDKGSAEGVDIWSKVKHISGAAAVSISESASQLATTASSVVSATTETIKHKASALSGSPHDENGKNEETANDATADSVNENNGATVDSKASSDGVTGSESSKDDTEGVWSAVRKMSISAADTLTVQAAAAWNVTKETTSKAVIKVKSLTTDENKQHDDSMLGETDVSQTENSGANIDDSSSSPEPVIEVVAANVAKVWETTKKTTTSAVMKIRTVINPNAVKEGATDEVPSADNHPLIEEGDNASQTGAGDSNNEEEVKQSSNAEENNSTSHTEVVAASTQIATNSEENEVDTRLSGDNAEELDTQTSAAGVEAHPAESSNNELNENIEETDVEAASATTNNEEPLVNSNSKSTSAKKNKSNKTSNKK
jgi:hypothetical protein